jgi:class 3 adenylate cyclase
MARVPNGSRTHHGRDRGRAHLTGEQISAINRFPDDNPNPVLRFDDGGRLIYANPASAGVLRAMGTEVGGEVPPDLIARLRAVEPARGSIDLADAGRTYAVWPVRIGDLGFTNLYGRDVTAERAIAKFPDENPNPVLRVDRAGRLLYANPASAALVAGLGLRLGGHVPTDLRDELLRVVDLDGSQSIEVDAGERAFALTAVEVPGFAFINVYGTEITALRERERLAMENERLLLNILPAPVAARLRGGAKLIADRFDDVTLMFADIVEFTRLSATMSPSELVTILNEVFTVFDELVDRYSLEKVKTIGDAYMVVGGLSDGDADHTARVAGMALQLADRIGAMGSARKHHIVFRIGIHRGPVVAGVIGTKRFIYDLWGDTVNLASRMESLGVPGRIQVTHAVRASLVEDFQFEARGLIDVKGKGLMPTWFLTGDGPDLEARRSDLRPAWNAGGAARRG